MDLQGIAKECPKIVKCSLVDHGKHIYESEHLFSNCIWTFLDNFKLLKAAISLYFCIHLLGLANTKSSALI